MQAWLKEHAAAAKGRTRSVLAGNALITHTVQLLEKGRQVAAAVHKAIVSTRRHRRKLPANDGLALRALEAVAAFVVHGPRRLVDRHMQGFVFEEYWLASKAWER